MNAEKKSYTSITLGRLKITAYLLEVVFQNNVVFIRSEIDRPSLLQALKSAAPDQPEDKRKLILDFVEKQELEIKDTH